MMEFCNDYGDEPLCEKTPDPRFAMSLDGETLLWCARCGPRAHAMLKAIEAACAKRGPAFVAEFGALVNAAEAEVSKH